MIDLQLIQIDRDALMAGPVSRTLESDPMGGLEKGVLQAERILADAIQMGAEEIYAAPWENCLRIRFRFGGAWRDIFRPRREYFSRFLCELELLGNLKFAGAEEQIHKFCFQGSEILVSVRFADSGEEISLLLPS